MKKKLPKSGFTIVELVVIIAVIAILVSISYVGFGAWRKDTATTQVQNELMHAAAALKQSRNFDSSYPDTAAFPAIYTPGADVDLSYERRASGSYCLNAVSQTTPSVKWNIDSAIGNSPRSGTCAP